DVHCFAWSEAMDGAGAGVRTMFAAVLGTGVSGVFVVDGTIVPGKNGIAGEWGHTPLPWQTAGEFPGPTCYCGRCGCLESYLSGRGLSRDHADTTGEHLPGEQIFARAHEGELGAQATLARYADRLARALGVIINLLDPDVIVLGGG